MHVFILRISNAKVVLSDCVLLFEVWQLTFGFSEGFSGTLEEVI